MDKDGNGTISISEFLNMSVNLMRSDSDTRDNSIPYSHNDRLNLTFITPLVFRVFRAFDLDGSGELDLVSVHYTGRINSNTQ